MSSKTTSIAIPIQNGQRTQSQDHEAIGWTDNSFKMTNTIPMTVRQPRPLDVVDFVDIDFFSFGIKFIISNLRFLLTFQEKRIQLAYKRTSIKQLLTLYQNRSKMLD